MNFKMIGLKKILPFYTQNLALKIAAITKYQERAEPRRVYKAIDFPISIHFFIHSY